MATENNSAVTTNKKSAAVSAKDMDSYRSLCFWSREKSGREKEYSFPVSLLTGSK